MSLLVVAPCLAFNALPDVMGSGSVMSIPWEFSLILARHNHIRTWAGDITNGNRCALVMGVALNLKPGEGDANFKGRDSANVNMKNMPFLENMFVKAEDVAFGITKKFGAPDLVHDGPGSFPMISSLKGVILLRNCWRTPKEKLTFSPKKTGDHIDLWDGFKLAIYPKQNESRALLSQSEKILFWKLNRSQFQISDLRF